ncbi:DUF4913 domain-containing protein [Streptomyces sp. NPDC004667]|uniref:DUF4913 domain-containing protein n=1 Tax=Streptomyces sp. NPDC004667 TaxID=3154285 RepID=UPI0033AB494F
MLWLAWERLRLESMLGMTTWWVQHADPHLRILMDPARGPFAGCSPEGTRSRRSDRDGPQAKGAIAGATHALCASRWRTYQDP